MIVIINTSIVNNYRHWSLFFQTPTHEIVSAPDESYACYYGSSVSVTLAENPFKIEKLLPLLPL